LNGVALVSVETSVYNAVMAYRDELEAAHQRVEDLERSLHDAKLEIARLKGETAAGSVLAADIRQSLTSWVTEPGDRSGRQRFFGAPFRLCWRREIDGMIGESAYASIVERVRDVAGNAGTISALKGSMTWTSYGPQGSAAGLVNVCVTCSDGRTRLRVEEHFGNWAGAIYGGIGGGVGGGGIMLPLSVAWVSPALVPFAVASWLGVVYLLCRRIFRGRVVRRAQKLAALAEALVAVVQDVVQPA